MGQLRVAKVAFSAIAFAAALRAQVAASPALPSPDTLAAAVRNGNIAEVRELLAAGVSADSLDSAGTTPLMNAAISGNTDIAAFLLLRGADPNLPRPETGATALEFAVLSNRTTLAEVLLRGGARPGFARPDGRTLLHQAAARGSVRIVASLLKARAEVNAVDSAGNTPLTEAVSHGQANAASVLISHGADVRRRRFLDGRTALDEACIKGFPPLVSLLIDAGADPGERDLSGQTSLDLALAYKNGNVVAVLHSGAKWTGAGPAFALAMQTSVAKNQTEIIKILLDAGFDLHQPTSAGSTYLHDAALKGNAKVVELLLNRGAAAGALNEDGGTPLHDAALNGSTSAIAVLLDRGADVNAIERRSGATPLMLAASMGRSEAVRLLLARAANPLVRDRSGRTALDRARQTEDSSTLTLLETAVARLKPQSSGKHGG